MENYRAEEVEPVSITYRGHTVLAARAVNGGTTALETLSVLNNLDIGARRHNSVEALHLFIEATRHAFADRYRFLGDPGIRIRSTQGPAVYGIWCSPGSRDGP